MRQADSERGDCLQLHPALDAAEPVPGGGGGETSGVAQEDLGWRGSTFTSWGTTYFGTTTSQSI